MRARSAAHGLIRTLPLVCGIAVACAPRQKLPPVPPAAPVREMGIVARGETPLESIPYDQPFAFVAPAVLFDGTVARDSFVQHARHQANLRQQVEVALGALSWREVERSQARFLVTILYAERRADGPTGAQVRAVSRDPSVQSYCTVTRNTTLLYRGLVVQRVSDGAIFWRLYAGSGLDNQMLEKRMGEDLVGMIMQRTSAMPPPNERPALTGSVTRCMSRNADTYRPPTTTAPAPTDRRNPGAIKPATEPVAPPPVRRP